MSTENVFDTNNEQHILQTPSQKLNIPLQDTDNQDHPTSRMLPPRNNTEYSPSPVHNYSLALSPIPHTIRPRPLLREASKSPSRHRPLSGARRDSKIRGANRSGLTNQTQSIGRLDDTSLAETESYSYSGLHNLHQIYQDIRENGSIVLGTNKRKSLATKVKSTYYKLLRKRFKRRNSHVAPDTLEFDDQIERIKKNIHIPNNERVADLKLEEMSRLERVEKYRDDYPLLEQRKSIMRFLCQMSIISNNIINHPIFDAFIILVIILNSIFLALDDPTSQEDTLSRVDNYFLGIYTVEMMLKIFGMGFIFPRNSYLRDPWNVLDFAIVATSYLTIALSSVELNLRALRSLRVLRPLRTISNIDNLRIIILTVMAALKPLLETFLILFFFFLIFAIAGLQLFSGVLKKRCFALDSGFALYDPDTDDNLRFCSSDDNCGVVDGIEYICGKMLTNPFNGYMNYDNIGSALLSTFVVVTMEGWSTLMKAVQMTFSPLVAVYFIAMVLIGGFVLMNLTLGVIKAEFTAHSNESIQARRVKKLTYDERLTNKLDENKLDVISLIHKYNAREIHYKKYQFKNDKLIAVENSKRRRSTLVVPRRRNAITPTGIEDLGKLKNLFSKQTRKDIEKISKSKIVPYDSGIENLVSTTKSSTRLSQKFKTFFTKNQTTEPSSSVSSITENQSPDDGTQIEQQPSTRGVGDFKIKITEASPLDGQDEEFFGNSPHPRRPSVPSVIEEEEEEEFSADTSSSPTFEASPRKSLLPSWVSKGKRMQKKITSNPPIRPIKSEKVLVGPKENKVELINIAGTPNTKQTSPQEIGTDKSLFLEDQVDDLMDDDHWFLESLRNQKTEEATIQNRDQQRAALIKKINQIKGLSEYERRNLIQSVRENDHSMIGSQDFDGNFSRNSLSRKGRSFTNNSSKAPLFPSDLMERKKDPRKSLMRQGSSLRRALKRPAIKKESNAIKEENDEGEGIGAKRNEVVVKEDDAMMSEEDVIELQEQEKHMVLDLRRLKTQPIYGREFDSYSLNDVLPSKKENERKKQEEDDQRRLRENKMEIVHHVTRREEEAALERYRHREEQQRKEATALAIKVSENAREVRKQLKEEEAFDAALELMKSRNHSGTRGSSGTGVKKSTTRRSSVKVPGSEFHYSSRQLSSAHGSQKNHLRKIKGEDEEEELTKEQMKDFFFLLAKIQTPYENEKEHEESEEYQKKIQVFDFQSDYTKTRRKDLEEKKIKSSNWSGNTVLNSTYNEFPADKAKRALNLQDWDIWRPGMMGVIHGLRRQAKAFSSTSIFIGVIMMSVFLNTLILCCNGLVTSTSVNAIFNQFNTAFTIIFALEMAIKVFGYGVEDYARDPFNLADAAIVVLSIVEAVTNSEKNSASTAFRALRLFRTLRVLRVTKLLRALSFMKILLGVIARSLRRCVYILILLLLMIFIYTCLGMQIFGGQLNFADNVGQDRIRQNFDTFIAAFMAVFQVNGLENWNDVLEITYRSSVSNVITISYLVSWIFIGNYLFLNLFLALLLDEFTGEEVEEELEELEEEEAPVASITRSTSLLSRKTHSKTHSVSSMNSQTFSLAEFDDEFFAGEDEVREMYKNLPCANSLYLFPKENWARRLCFKISKHKYFEYGILFVIILNFFKLILDTYIPSDATSLNKISDIFNYIFVVIFVIEALIRIFSLGLVLDKGTYLRDGWNFIDFVVLVASIVDIFFQSTNLSFFRAFRLLRALRPLRFISHNQNMRIIVNALFESMGPILNVLIVVAIIWLMFAILAVNLVGGQFGRCSNLPSDELYYGISKEQCEQRGYIWKDWNANFNNVFQGILSLFIISTQEDWPDIMFWMSDANSSDVGPIENKNRLFANLFFLFFIFIGQYFLVNLFTGVIFLNYERAQKREEFRHKFLTPDQRKWVAIQSLVLFTKPDITIVEPTAKWMKPFFKLIIHDNFEYFMMGSIVVNILTMGLSYDGSPQSYRDALTYVNYFFTAIFALEMIIKHLGLGFRKYWSSRWNRFDGFVVMASLVEIVVSALNTSVLSFLRSGPQIVRIFRVLRVSRLFKLIKRATGLRKLINTLIFSLPALFNVAALLFLVYSIFAIIATFLFKDVAQGDIIDGQLNFHNFLNSWIAVFRGSTGEDWWYIMFDTIYPAACVEGVSSCAANFAAAMVFWIIMDLMIQFIFLNLFVLIVIQQFEEYHLDPNNPVNKFHEKLRLEFNPTWQIISAKHGGDQIHEKQLTLLFMSLNAPLGFRNQEMTKKEIALEITSMYLTS